MKKRLILFSVSSILSLIVTAQNVGIGTTAPLARLHVTDSAVLFSGAAVLNPTINPPVQGAGIRMMWYPQKAAFRAGAVDDGTMIGLPGFCATCPLNWNKDSIGNFSLAAGFGTKAKGTYSLATGALTNAIGHNATAMGQQTTASGSLSTAMGFVTNAAGNYATATGVLTTAGGYASFSMGDSSIASGYAATAMGYKTKATGDLSTSMGNVNTATGFGATSMGFLTLASGNTSTSMGISTVASGGVATSTGVDTKAKAYAGFTMGMYNDTVDTPNPMNPLPDDRIFQIGNGIANDQRSNAFTVLRNGNVGLGTTAPLAKLHVADSAVIFTTEGYFYSVTPKLQVGGPGRRLVWFPAKAAFRVGIISNNDWDSDSIGPISVAMGANTKAYGYNSTSLGANTLASNYYSTSMGFLTKATGEQSTAMGASTQAQGDNSTTMGLRTTASGNASTAIGQDNTASGTGSTASGAATTASGSFSFSAGEQTFAKARAGFVAGLWNDTGDNPDNNLPSSFDRIFQIGNGTSNAARSNALTILRNGNIGLGTTMPNARLQFPNDINQRKLVLYETANNNHQFYGFGVTSSALRYQTATTGDDHVFYAGTGTTTSQELMRLRGIGFLGLGNYPDFRLDVSGRMRVRSGGDANSSAGIVLNNNGNSALHSFLGVKADDEAGFYGYAGSPGWRFYVNTSTGNAFLQGTLTQNSDARLKKNIAPLQNNLQNIQHLTGYTYNWKDENADSEIQIGLLAQEVQKVYPQLVKETNGTLSVNYSGLIPVLLEALKEQQQQIEIMKNENRELKTIVKQVLEKINK